MNCFNRFRFLAEVSKKLVKNCTIFGNLRTMTFPFDSGNIHIKESKKPGFTFPIELRTKICLISWSKKII